MMMVRSESGLCGWVACKFMICVLLYINKKFTIVVGSRFADCIAHTFVRFSIQSRWFSVVVNNTAAESKNFLFSSSRESYKKNIKKKIAFNIGKNLYISSPILVCATIFSLSHSLFAFAGATNNNTSILRMQP